MGLSKIKIAGFSHVNPLSFKFFNFFKNMFRGSFFEKYKPFAFMELLQIPIILNLILIEY